MLVITLISADAENLTLLSMTPCVCMCPLYVHMHVNRGICECALTYEWPYVQMSAHGRLGSLMFPSLKLEVNSGHCSMGPGATSHAMTAGTCIQWNLDISCYKSHLGAHSSSSAPGSRPSPGPSPCCPTSRGSQATAQGVGSQYPPPHRIGPPAGPVPTVDAVLAPPVGKDLEFL